MKTIFKYWLSTSTIAAVAFSLLQLDLDIPPLIQAIGSYAASLPAMAALFIVLHILRLFFPDAWRERLFLLSVAVLIAVYILFSYEILSSADFHIGAIILIVSNGASYVLLRNDFRQSMEISGSDHTAIEVSATPNENFSSPNIQSIKQKPIKMQTQNRSESLMWKGLITLGITGVLIVAMNFVTNLINERKERQQEVVQEVSSKWANPQTFAGPFLSVPYIEEGIDSDKKPVKITSQVLLMPNTETVDAQLKTEVRKRSLFKVLLYRTAAGFTGKFNLDIPASFDVNRFDFSKAKICFALSDFKGIEKAMTITLGDREYALEPGLPVASLGNVGLSAPVALTPDMLRSGIGFSMSTNIKGNSELKFMPLAKSSEFKLAGDWGSPSFTGNTIPLPPTISKNGFAAQWNFNSANLPFTSAVKDDDLHTEELSFGLSLVEPANNYAKAMRSAKYAILIIVLTFATFFVVEILQKRPFHPVQYILFGVALLLFYTLLVSISEYIAFNMAYLISAVATVLLISLYAKAHFRSWAVGMTFFAALSALYGFIFVLISLEDTALLTGSIALFVILAGIMYATRGMKWYGTNPPTALEAENAG